MRTPRSFSKSIMLLGLASLYVPLVDGCNPYGKYDWAVEVGRKIDPVAAGVEEYGTISMSSPLFAFPAANDDTFTFDLNRDAETYFKEAKSEIQGAAAVSSQRSVDTKGGVKLQADINQIMSNLALMEGYRDDLSAFKQKRGLKNGGTMLESFLPLLGVVSGPESIIKDLGGPDAFMKLLGIPTEEELAAAAAEEAAVAATAVDGGTDEENGAGGDGSSDDEQGDGDDQADGHDKDKEEPKSPLTRLVEALGEGATGAGEGLSGENKRPVFPPLGDKVPAVDTDVLPAEGDRIAKNALAKDKFHDFMELLKDETKPTVSNRSAIITAAGDKTTEAILRFISNPAKAAGFKDKPVLFGVATVAVNPGHRTYRGYAADIAVQASVDYVPARPELIRKLKKNGDQKTKEFITAVEIANDTGVDRRFNSLEDTLHKKEMPETIYVYGGSIENSKEWDRLQKIKSFSDKEREKREDLTKQFSWWITQYGWGIAEVAAVSPMTETQTLDLKSSIRRQKSAALKLAAALSGYGAKGQAQVFKDYVQRLEQDVSTRSAINVTTSYSQSGEMFGFRITPRLKALSDASSAKARPAMTMDPLAFPVLILVGLKESSVGIRVRVLDGQFVFVEPMITLYQTSRWMPQGDPINDDKLFGRWWDRCWKPRLKESERWAWAARLEAAGGELKGNLAREDETSYSFKSFAKRRLQMFRNQALGSESQQHLPLSVFLPKPAPAKAPKATNVVYPPIVADGTKEYPIYVVGANLSRVLTSHTDYTMLIGKGAVTKAEHVGDGQNPGMILTFRPDRVSGGESVVLNLPYKDESGDIQYVPSPAVEVSPPSVKMPIVRKLISNRQPNGKMRIVLVGEHLPQIDLSGITVITNSGKVENPLETHGVIYFDFTPDASTVQHMFRLPFKKAIRGKVYTDTEVFINTPPAARPPNKGAVIINRDGDGRITRVETGDGGFANAAELLRLIKDALNDENAFSLELNAEGSAEMSAGAKAGT